SASTLLGLAAPLVLDAVGKEAESRHLDARGLSAFLTDQARSAAGALPGALSGAVGALPSESSAGVFEETRQRAQAPAGARERAGGTMDEMRQRLRSEHER